MSMRICSLILMTTLMGLAMGLAPAEKTPKKTTTKPAGPSIKSLRADIVKLTPLHEKLGKPKPGEWLDRFKEPGQSFRQYLFCRPTLPRGKRRVLYIQPIGKFTASQRKIVNLTGEFMGIYFNRPVKILKDLPLATIPASARRTHPDWGDKQILTSYVLDKLLRPKLPKDAAAFLALTATDLWPGDNWNFVFGQASLRHRVGVWSIYRNGDPDEDIASFRLCLRRTIQTATHETGHMFSMLHCTVYKCNMCGSNSREESDSHPLALGPQCVAKVCWATQIDPRVRYKALLKFARKQGLKKEADFYAKSLKALEQ